MKLSWSILTKTALTMTVLSGVTPVNAQQPEVDIYLDALDADGHLSILGARENKTEIKAQKVKTESLAEEAVAATEVVKEKYSAKKEAHAESHDNKAYTEVAAIEEVHAENHGSAAYAEVAAAPKADAHAGDHGYSSGSTDKGFLTKSTTEVEFTFAILVIIIGLIASERFQRAKDEQMQDGDELANTELYPIEES